ncbi:MAG: DUF4430 domain-containing protein [Oscillospiraceae bacterium]|nr:DUF4430 domain-containing protein [Oscillospiraceae bacterium]
MKRILSCILCLAMALALAACAPAPKATEPPAFQPVTDGQSVGSGAVSFPLEIIDKDGNSVKITVSTDKETVGEAQLELGLVEGDSGEYGLYIKSVNGIVADYDVDATYWAFYINGEYAMTGVEMTPIAEGDSYLLKVEK